MSHSLIFNLREIVWGNYFEDYETDEIRQYNAVELPEMPADVIKYLSQLKGLTEEEIYNKLSTENFDIVSDEKWIQEAFSQAVRLMKCRVLPINKAKVTKNGLVKRLWYCIDTCYDFSPITCTR